MAEKKDKTPKRKRAEDVAAVESPAKKSKTTATKLRKEPKSAEYMSKEDMMSDDSFSSSPPPPTLRFTEQQPHALDSATTNGHQVCSLASLATWTMADRLSRDKNLRRNGKQSPTKSRSLRRMVSDLMPLPSRAHVQPKKTKPRARRRRRNRPRMSSKNQWLASL